MKTKLLYIGMKYDYGDRTRGISFEHRNIYHSLKSYSKIQYWNFIHYDFMERGLILGIDSMTQELYELAKKEKPTYLLAVLFDFHRDPGHEVFKQISSLGTITIHWFCDDHWRFEKYSSVVAPHFDFVCTTANSALPKYEKLGISDKVIKTQWACNYELYVPYDIEKDLDISFVGQPHGNRVEVLSKLCENGLKLEVFGYGWKNRPRLTFHQMVRKFSMSKINLNLSNSSTLIGQQIKGRNFEIPGTRSFQLTSNAENLSEYYEDGKEIVIFNTAEELVDKATYYLKSEKERNIIAENGYKRTLAEHTWHHRLDKIFSYITTKQFASNKIEKITLNTENRATQEPSSQAFGPFVSVIIPCYNQAHFLPDAVESVVNQTFTNWECIIVNDGSPDNTNEVAQQLIAKHPNKIIRLLEKLNGGLADARNTGITISQGVYWLPLDADDTITTTFLEKTVQILETRSDVGFVYSHIQHFGTQHNVYYLPDFDADTIIHTDNIGCVCSLVRKSVWKEVGGYKAEMKEGYEDWDFWIGCIEKGWKGYRIAEALFNYRKKENTMLHHANTKREKLIARIVINHSGLYHKRRLTWAEHILQEKSAETRPSHVLIACTHFWPSMGGLETIAEFLGNYLVRTGYQVDVATLYRQDRMFHLYRGMKILSLDALRMFNNTPLWVRQLRQLVTSGQYDACILMADPLNPIIWSLHQADIRSNTKIIIQPLINKDGYAKWCDNKSFRRNLADILKKAHAVVALTRDGVERQYFNEEGIPSILIPNAVDTAVPVLDFRAEFNIQQKSFVILHIANLWPVKNHLGILDTLRSMPTDWRLVMIGHPSQEQSYVSQVQEAIRRNPQVIYIPGLSREGVAAALEAADVVILASYGEVSPITILEAMSQKKPWIATPECGAVHDLTGGIIVPLKDFTKVLSLLSNSEWLQKLGSVGYEHWQACYYWPSVILAWDELIQTGSTQKTFDIPELVMQKQKTLQAQIIEKLNESTPPGTNLTHKYEASIHRVSVIVPTYNRPDTLKRTLESIAAQTYKHIEAIVVNDAGEDVSGVIDTFHDRLSIKYIVHDKNNGVAAARNTAIKHASGNYIAYLDDDDIFYPNHLESLVDYLEATGYSAAYSDSYQEFLILNGDRNIIVNKRLTFSQDFDKEKLIIKNYIPVLSVVHRRDCIEEVGLFDEGLKAHEDWDFWIRMSQRFDFHHVRAVTSEFRTTINGDSLTLGKRQDFLNTMKIIHSRYSHLVTHPRTIDAQKEIENELEREIYSRGKMSVKPLTKSKSIDEITSGISVVVPVRNGGKKLKGLLEKIRSQRKVQNIEIIVIDSGSEDNSMEIAEEFGARVIGIPQIEFNHGKTRNHGVSEARGDYIVFTVQDAMPINDYWLFNMVNPFLEHSDLSALSSRQFVKPEADLFSLWKNLVPFTSDTLWLLSATANNVDWGLLNSLTKDTLTYLDNVSSCVRRSIFNEVQFNPLIFGEDIDLARRLIERGKSIGYLASTGVYHWHERGAEYILRRFFIGSKTEVGLRQNELPYFFKKENIDLNTLLANMIGTYDLIKFSIDMLGDIPITPVEAVKTFLYVFQCGISSSTDRLVSIQSSNTQFKPPDGSHELELLLKQLIGDIPLMPESKYNFKQNFLIPGFMNYFEQFAEYLCQNHKTLEGRDRDFKSSIYNIFAMVAGEAVAACYLEAESLNCLTPALKRMGGFLEKGVCYF